MNESSSEPSERTSAIFAPTPSTHLAMKKRAALGYDDDPAGTSVIRLAPLLLVRPEQDERYDLCVGAVRVAVSAVDKISLEFYVNRRWQVVASEVQDDESNRSGRVAEYALEQITSVLPASSASDEPADVAARYAKAACEVARNNVVELRELRYEIEQRLAGESTDETADEELNGIVSSLLLLSIACGRAEDVARDASREGLWAYINDDEAYHAYRKLRDPTIMSDHDPATAQTRTWMRLHDNGVRHCDAMAAQLNDESAAIIGLLEAASSISSARDADAQTRMNTLIALVSLGLGVPALVLALYGAQLILPLETTRQQVAFIPVALSLVAAAVLALLAAPKKGRPKRLWIFAAVAVLVVLISLIVGGVVLVEHPM